MNCSKFARPRWPISKLNVSAPWFILGSDSLTTVCIEWGCNGEVIIHIIHSPVMDVWPILNIPKSVRTTSNCVGLIYYAPLRSAYFSRQQLFSSSLGGTPLRLSRPTRETRISAVSWVGRISAKMPFRMGVVSRDLDFEGLPVRIWSWNLAQINQSGCSINLPNFLILARG